MSFPYFKTSGVNPTTPLYYDRTMVVVVTGFHCISHNYVFTNDSELGKNVQTGFAIGDTKREVKGMRYKPHEDAQKMDNKVCTLFLMKTRHIIEDFLSLFTKLYARTLSILPEKLYNFLIWWEGASERPRRLLCNTASRVCCRVNLSEHFTL